MILQELIEQNLPLIDEHKGHRARFVGVMDFAWTAKDTCGLNDYEAPFDVEIHEVYPGKFEVVLRQDEPQPGDREIFFGGEGESEIAQKLLRETGELIAGAIGCPVNLKWGHDFCQTSDRFVMVLDASRQHKE